MVCIDEVAWIADREAANVAHAQLLPGERRRAGNGAIIVATVLALTFAVSIAWGAATRFLAWIMYWARDHHHHAADRR